MTTIQTARFARSAIAATLIAGSLLTLSARPSMAGDIGATEISDQQTQSTGATVTAPASNKTQTTPVRDTVPSLGTVGFGWG